MASVLDMYDRLELDAHKFAKDFKNTDDKTRSILESAFLLSEQHIVTKIMKHFMKKQMKKYTGTKQVLAEPMNELAATEKGFARKNEDSHEWRQGYHVQYTNPDGSTYDSWSPKQVFEKNYRVSETFIDRLNIELNEVKTRFESLKSFLIKYSFDELEKEVGAKQAALLLMQKTFMEQYVDILEIRIDDLKNKNHKTDIDQ